MERMQLTGRERDIVELAANGKTDKEIAGTWEISIATVRTYWNRIRKKTGTCNRTHAVCVALGVAEELGKSR